MQIGPRLLFATALVALSSACSSGKTPATGDDLSNGDPGSSSSDDAGGLGGGGGLDVGGVTLEGGSGGGEPGDGGACAATSSTASLIPLDIFIMQDQSGSMKETTSTGATKWEAVKAAIKTFVSDPASAGIGVGLQFFGV